MTTPGATEGQQLIKRTQSEEEILKKRPKRKVVAKKIDEGSSVGDDRSEIDSIASIPMSEGPEKKTNSNSSLPTQNVVKSNRKVKPPPLPSRQIVGQTSKLNEVEKRQNVVQTSKLNEIGKTPNGSLSKLNDVDRISKKSEIIGSNGSSNGGAKGRIRPESRIITEEKRSQSLTRIIPSSNDNYLVLLNWHV
jgi:hypothetical protein